MLVAIAVAAIFLSAIMPSFAHAEAAVALPASQAIQRFEAGLLRIMQAAHTLGYSGRYQRLQPEIDQAFDFQTMTRIVAGSAWNGWDETERAQIVGAFRDFVIATYARRFDFYSGERFGVEAELPVRGGVLVKTRLIRTAGAPVEIDYLTHDTGHGPQIIDVFLAGTISELAVRRSEFASVLRQDGYGGLLAALRRRVAVE